MQLLVTAERHPIVGTCHDFQKPSLIIGHLVHVPQILSPCTFFDASGSFIWEFLLGEFRPRVKLLACELFGCLTSQDSAERYRSALQSAVLRVLTVRAPNFCRFNGYKISHCDADLRFAQHWGWFFFLYVHWPFLFPPSPFLWNVFLCVLPNFLLGCLSSPYWSIGLFWILILCRLSVLQKYLPVCGLSFNLLCCICWWIEKFFTFFNRRENRHKDVIGIPEYKSVTIEEWSWTLRNSNLTQNGLKI